MRDASKRAGPRASKTWMVASLLSLAACSDEPRTAVDADAGPGMCADGAATCDDRDAAEDASDAADAGADAADTASDAGEVICGDGGSSFFRKEELAGCTVVRGLLHFSDHVEPTLAGLESVRVVEGSLLLFRNENLVDLSGLRNLERVSGKLAIRLCTNLSSLAGLRSLRSVDELLILSNFSLPQLEAEAFANQLEVREVNVSDNKP